MSDQNENIIEIPAWVTNTIGKLSLENEYLKQENAALREYIQNSGMEVESIEESENGN
jgi:hypothetical protein